MSEVKTKKVTSKGNKTTEIILGSAAVKLQSAVNGLNSAVAEVAKLEEKASEGILKVTDLEDKIGALVQDLANKTAQNKIDLQLAYDADQKSFVDKWLSANNLETISSEALQQLKDNLDAATNKVDETVKAAVGAATGSLTKEHNNELKIKDLEFEKKEADNLATIKQMQEKVKFMEEQTAYWKTLLDNQQKAETERAKYGQISTLNVGGTTQGR